MPGLDEDTATMSIEAARNALARAGFDSQEIGLCGWAARAIRMRSADRGRLWPRPLGPRPTPRRRIGSCCKAGTEAMQAGIGFVGSGMARYVLAIGMDTAQGRPGDAPHTAAAGGAALSGGPASESCAIIRDPA